MEDTTPLAISPSLDLKELSRATESLFDRCDDILGIEEYQHDRIVWAFTDTLTEASKLDKKGLLSPEEHSDCLAMQLLLSDALESLFEVRAKLYDRVKDGRSRLSPNWTKARIVKS